MKKAIKCTICIIIAMGFHCTVMVKNIQCNAELIISFYLHELKKNNNVHN